AAQAVRSAWRGRRSCRRRRGRLARLPGELVALLVARPLQRAPGLGQEHVVERRGVELQVLHLQVLLVERPDDVGEVGVAEPNRGAVARGERALAEALQ